MKLDRTIEREFIFAERITKAESELEHHAITLRSHDRLINEMSDKIGVIVDEMRQIRNALYIMATVISLTIPALQDLLRTVKGLIGF